MRKKHGSHRSNYWPGVVMAVLFSAAAAFAMKQDTVTFTSFGALTCGAGNAGITKVTAAGIVQVCGNEGTPLIHYVAEADSTGKALAGDTATAFFAAGQIEAARGGTGASNAATSGRYLKGDGTNFVTSTGSASGTGTCTNQFVTAANSDAAPTCTTPTLASAQFANQGTTTTVLHGNAAGNPSFAAVNLTTTVTGILPGSNGGTNSAFFQVSGPTALRTYTFPDLNATIPRILTGTASIDFGATAANTCDDGGTTISVTGAVDGDACVVGVPNALASVAHVQLSCRVSAADVVTVRLCNVSTAAIADPAAQTIRATIVK